MKAVYMEKPWEIKISDIPVPEPQEGEALLKIHSAGICGSDIGAFRGANNLVSYPRVIGHELAGEIVSLNSGEPKGLHVGDKVVVDPYLYCGHCYPCSIGRTNCCTNLRVLGVHVDGGMSEFFAHPVDMLVKVPDDMPWEFIPMAEPLTIALHGLHRLQVKAGEYIVIIGAGTIGLLAAITAMSYGAVPILVDVVEERLAFARKQGIAHTIDSKKEDQVKKVLEYTGGRLAECVMEASGANSAIRGTLDIVCNAGRIVFTGWPKLETQLPTDVITRKELDIRGARTSAGEFQEAIDLIYQEKIDIRPILTKVIPVDAAPETIRDIERHPGNYLKVDVMF